MGVARDECGESRPAVRSHLASSNDGYWSEALDVWAGDRPQELWRRHSDAVNRTLLERWLRSRGPILKTDLWDEAVGDGLYPALSRISSEVVGIDSSEEVASRARTRYPDLEATVADVRALPFPDGRFDAVVSNSTLDHFESVDEIAAALAELRRVLRPGGELLLTLDNPLNPIVGLTKILPRAALHRQWLRLAGPSRRVGLLPYFVGATVGPRSLDRIIREQGFDPQERATVVHAPRVVAVLVGSLLQRRGSQRAQRQFLAGLAAFERLESWPTRYVTGHFIAVRARRG